MPTTTKKIPAVKFNLLKIMEERKLTPADVADLCTAAGTPLTRITIYNMINPLAHGVYLSTLTALCNGLKVTPAELFTMDE